MKHPLRFSRLAVLLFLGALGAPISSVLAQNADSPEGVFIVPSEAGLQLNVHAKGVNILDVVSGIAARGHLEIITRGEISGKVTMNMTGAPETVLQFACSGNALSCRKVGGVWNIEAQTKPLAPTDAPTARLLDLAFRDIEASFLIKMLSDTYGLNAQASPEVKSKIALIHLIQLTPRQALEQVALAANLELVEKENQILIAPKKPDEK